MILTNDERREVAAALRENRDPLTPYNLPDYIFEDPWNHNSGEEVADRLADLIDPTVETCEVDLTDTEELRVTVRTYECSKCGMSWEQVWAHDFTYCPYCGRRVSNAD